VQRRSLIGPPGLREAQPRNALKMLLFYIYF